MTYIIQAICSMGLSPMGLIPDGQPANAHTSVHMQLDTKWGQSCLYPLILMWLSYFILKWFSYFEHRTTEYFLCVYIAWWRTVLHPCRICPLSLQIGCTFRRPFKCFIRGTSRWYNVLHDKFIQLLCEKLYESKRDHPR